MSSINPSAMYRISGLASGMDIDSIVSDLMRAHRMRLDKVEQEKQIWQWRQEDYRAINTDLLSLKNEVFDLKLQRTFLAKKVDSSSSAVSAAAGPNALNGSHTVEVISLARRALLASNSAISTSGAYTEPLSEMLEGLGLVTDANGKITVQIGDGTSTPQDFTIDANTQSLSYLIQQINSSSLNLKASWDDNLKRFYLTSTKLGEKNVVSYTDKSGNLMGTLFNNGTESLTVTGTDAQVKIDGIDYSFDSNQFKVNDVTYTLKGTTTGPVNITISDDIDAVVNTIKNFISKYNDTLAAINGKLNEERYPDFRPLTDEQLSSAQLTDKQIDQWQEKARSGLLKGDLLLEKAATSMRTILSSRISGLTDQVTVTNGSQQITTLANQLSVLGITTGSYLDKGKLYLDENRLKEALQSNPQAVMELFTRSKDASGNDITDSSEQGLAVQLYNAVNNAISLVTDKAGSAGSLYDNSFISKKVRGIASSISKMEDRLQAMETRYYKQFTAMEQAIARMNTQSMWLAQQFSGNS
jgi:flagellar hook-associated protein 2